MEKLSHSVTAGWKVSQLETKTIYYSLWLAFEDEYRREGWDVRGYELHGPLSLPTHVDIVRPKAEGK